MRRYVEADRKFDAAAEKRKRRRKRGCLGNLLRLLLFAAVIAGGLYLIWLWHPWETEYVELDASEHPGICSPGVEGTRTVEHLTIFGHRVAKTGESTICVE